MIMPRVSTRVIPLGQVEFMVHDYLHGAYRRRRFLSAPRI